MRYDEITAALSRANPDEWVVLPEVIHEERDETVVALRDDLTATLVLFRNERTWDFDDFDYSWVPAYEEGPASSGTTFYCLELRDHGLTVVRTTIVGLDGSRWFCPLPVRSEGMNWTLSPENYRLGGMLHVLISSGDSHSWHDRLDHVAEDMDFFGGHFHHPGDTSHE